MDEEQIIGASAIDKILEYDQKRGGMSINEVRARWGSYFSWTVASRRHLLEVLDLMSDDDLLITVRRLVPAEKGTSER